MKIYRLDIDFFHYFIVTLQSSNQNDYVHSPSIKIVTISTEEIICQSNGPFSIDGYKEDKLDW